MVWCGSCRQIEGKIVEISRLQEIFADKVLQQVQYPVLSYVRPFRILWFDLSGLRPVTWYLRYVVRWGWPVWLNGRAFARDPKRSRVWISAGPLPGNCLGQAAHTHVPLSPSSITWYRPMGGDALRPEGNLAESNGSLPPGGWLQATCGLTACTPGSAPGPTLGNEYGRTLTFILVRWYLSNNLLLTLMHCVYGKSSAVALFWHS